ncbi:MAG: hypothetical protein AB1529_08215, partial [Candidatus Micrarchaeota archaeon]
MRSYIALRKDEQISLLKQAKVKRECTWETIAKELGVNRSMVFLYLSGSKLPKNSFNKYLTRRSGLPVTDRQFSIPSRLVEEGAELRLASWDSLVFHI